MRKTHLLTLAASLLLVITTSSVGNAVRDTHTTNYVVSLQPIYYTPAEPTKKKYAHKDSVKLMVVEEAKRLGVPAKLALAVARAESNFTCSARSSAGALGVMQIKHRTAKGLGYKGTAKGLLDCRTGIHWGMKYLKEALKRAKGNQCVAAHLYFSGVYAKRMTSSSKGYCRKVMKYM